ncbi:MAG: hypothetical protein H6722_30675 [Sandaracinus sp.]|nr:hypothetical protein [Myxococcales bacterium]MCB9599545.1 hypothetical protein [Sandaracinus sp.]MCB9616821.1 hypothetical protein [Sandaracinus sp.]
MESPVHLLLKEHHDRVAALESKLESALAEVRRLRGDAARAAEIATARITALEQRSAHVLDPRLAVTHDQLEGLRADVRGALHDQKARIDGAEAAATQASNASRVALEKNGTLGTAVVILTILGVLGGIALGGTALSSSANTGGGSASTVDSDCRDAVRRLQRELESLSYRVSDLE